MSNPYPHTDRFKELDIAVDIARERLAQARDAQKTDSTVSDLLHPLAELHKSIRYERPDAPSEEDRDDRERKLRDRLLKEIREQDLRLEPAGSGVQVVKPHPDYEVRRCQLEHSRALQERNQYAEAHRDELEAEAEAAERERFRAAAVGGDLDIVREVLSV